MNYKEKLLTTEQQMKVKMKDDGSSAKQTNAKTRNDSATDEGKDEDQWVQGRTNKGQDEG